VGSLGIEVPVTLELEDLDDLDEEQVQRLEDDVRDNMENTAANMAQALAPVRTGNLLFSIYSDVDDTFLRMTVGATANYASYVEYGTFRMPARPFLRPAADMGREEIDARVQEAIISRLDGKLESSEEGDNVTLEIEGQAPRFEGGLFGALEGLE
jgi:HK97 gp10 family phage protein